MNYLIIYTSGKQYCFKPDEWQTINFLKEASLGDYIVFQNVLFYRKGTRVQLGRPFLKNAYLIAKNLFLERSKKLSILKTKPKKKYTRTKGQVQQCNRIVVQEFH